MDDGKGSSFFDLDELWKDEALDEPVFVDGEEPEAFLSENDLSLLYEIDMPTLSQEDTPASVSNGQNPQKISLNDLTNLATDLSYFYLRDELGLGEDVMWKIANSGASTILMLKVPTIRNKVELLRRTIKMSDEELRKLLSAQPSLLQLSANKNLSPTILFLLRHLDLGAKDLKTLILGCPSLLTYSIPNLQKKLAFFEITMGCTIAETRKILLAEPKIMTSSLEEGLHPRYSFMRQEAEISCDDLRAIIIKNPRILVMSVDHNLQPKIIFFMIMTLRMNTNDICKLLSRFPGFLDYNLDNHILPIARYFLSLELSTHEVGKILLKFPRLITNSLVKIKHTVGYLRFELGLDADGVRRILYQAPEILGLSAANLESKVEYFSGIMAPSATCDDTSIQMLGKLIVGMPSLLHLNIKGNVEPKVSYLKSRLGESGLSEALQRMPMLLGYSLEKRIKPRMEMILDFGLDSGAITVGIPKGEEAFIIWVEKRALERRQREYLIEKQGSGDHVDTSLVDDYSSPGGAKNSKKMQQDGEKITHWTRPRRPPAG